MNKTQLAHELAARLSISDYMARELLTATFEVLADQLCLNESVTISGFGTFRRKWSAERTSRNPQTGEPVHVPSHWRVTMTVGKTLRDRVRALPTQSSQ